MAQLTQILERLRSTRGGIDEDDGRLSECPLASCVVAKLRQKTKVVSGAAFTILSSALVPLEKNKFCH